MKTAILILAAGSSNRMRTQKQLLPVHTTTLLGIVIKNALQSKADAVFCVLGSEFKKVKDSIKNFDIEIINNTNYNHGLSSSINAGVNHINSKLYDAVLIVLGDQPKVNSKYLNKLIDTFKANQNKIVASSYKNNLGVPAIFPRNTFDQLQMLEGDKGAKDVLNSNSKSIISIKADSKLLDIDTKEDYNNYLNSL